MSELAAQVRAALAAQGPTGRSGRPDRMGLFSAPFRPAGGPLEGHILKPYRSGRDLEVLEPLARRHATYLECLERTGLKVPRTELLLLDEHAVLRPVVVQRAVPEASLFANLVAQAETAAALRVLEQVSVAICGFWSGVAQRPERIGLHASPHSFAIDETGQVVFLDTFPPLIGYSREAMGRILLRFSESGMMRGIGALLPGRSREIQDPWYSLPGNLGLVIACAIRLRPADHAAIQTWAETFAADSLTASDRDALIKGLPRPRPNIATDRMAKRLGAGLRPNA
jgi:hypothetical protein